MGLGFGLGIGFGFGFGLGFGFGFGFGLGQAHLAHVASRPRGARPRDGRHERGRAHGEAGAALSRAELDARLARVRVEVRVRDRFSVRVGQG